MQAKRSLVVTGSMVLLGVAALTAAPTTAAQPGAPPENPGAESVLPEVPLESAPSNVPEASRAEGAAPEATPRSAVPGDAAPASAPAAAAPAPVPTQLRRVVLTISGGISLGSYEAGLNWSLLRLIKASQSPDTPKGAFAYPIELVSMTGASAGNINAFLSAVEWLSTPSKEHPATDRRWTAQGNLFWDAWIPVGLDQLFPGEKSCDDYAASLGETGPCRVGQGTYGPEDAVFSRRAFTRIIAALKARMAEPFEDTDRTFPLGVTVSKVKPERVEGASLQSLDVKTQRFAVLLTAQIEHGQLVFRQPLANNPALVGNQLFLRSKGGIVHHDDVLDVIQASSAFPLAFGPKQLKYCLPAQLVDGDCSAFREERFFDGGLFDNLPMGLALETLAQTRTFPGASAPAQPGIDYSLMYLDPARRRNLGPFGEAPLEQDPADAGHGVDYLLGLVGRFISVARTYELQSSVRFGSGVARPEGTSRYLPIFGGYLGAFAGFLARPFREFDFHAGVYDGIYHVASLTCDGKSPTDPRAYTEPGLLTLQEKRAACLLGKVQAYLDLLGLAPDSATGYLVRQTLPLELGALLTERAAAFAASQAQAYGALRQASPRGTEADRDLQLMQHLLPRMIEVRAAHLASGREPSFNDVLDRLGDLGQEVALGDEDRSGQALFSNRRALIGTVARDIAQRLVDIEGAPTGAETQVPVKVTRLGPFVADAAQLTAETYFNGLEYENRLRWSPSSIPSAAGIGGKIWDGIFPYYGTIDFVSAGVELGYLPTLHLWGSGSGLTTPIAPLSWRREDGTLGGRAGLGYVQSGRWWIMSRLEASPYFRFDYASNPDGWVGGEVALQILFNHIRISGNVDFFHALRSDDTGATGDRWGWHGASIRLGLSDLNGLGYWIGRAL